MPRIARVIAAEYPHHITQRGPLGSEEFMKKLERKLSRRILPGKAGRPKKEKVE